MEKIVLNNGIEVYLDYIPKARTLGLYAEVGIGSIHAPSNKGALPHLVEH